MRSMATRGQSGGLSPSTGRCLELLAAAGEFELVIIETVGTGQEALPFSSDLVDLRVLVMNPDYGSRLQLQKIAMLDAADLVVVNKGDLQGARHGQCGGRATARVQQARPASPIYDGDPAQRHGRG